jgi:hypothetical protein
MSALRVKPVNSLEAYISLLEKLRSKRIKRLWFRGCGKASHKLIPSIYRHKQHQTIDEILVLEKELLARFRQRSIPFHSRPLTTSGNGFSSCSIMAFQPDFWTGPRAH